MTTDEAKAELKEVAKCNRLIKTLQETIAQNRARLTSISVQLSPDKVQTTHSNDQMAEGVAEIMNLEADLNTKIKELAAKKRKIINKIWNIPSLDERNVLIARYINGQELFEIGDKFNFGVKQVTRLHGKALSEYCKFNEEPIQAVNT